MDQEGTNLYGGEINLQVQWVEEEYQILSCRDNIILLLTEHYNYYVITRTL